MDMILNGNASGSVASKLLANGFNVNALRPWVEDGKSFVTQMVGNEATAIQTNETATLRKDDWVALDTAILKAAQPRLKAVGDLRAAGLEYGLTNGLGRTVLEYERMSDISPASVTMDGLERGKNDRPVFDLVNLPLPITHSDFEFSARQIAASRNGGSPLDTTMAELAARKVSEKIEQTLLGNAAGTVFGGGTVQGYTNYTPRITTVTLTDPTDSGWTPSILVGEVLDMVAASMAAYHYGPWQLYYGPAWSRYMNDEYKAESNDTMLTRLARIDNIRGVSMLDYLEDFDLVLVQFTPDVVRIVNGMDITTVQWESNGGMLLHFKVMAIMVPQLRCDINNKTGIVHARVLP